MAADDVTAQAVELAERVLDEVSRPTPNWSELAGWARALAALADAAAARSARGRTPEER